MTAIKKPNKYNETQGYGEFKSLPAGGYVVKILKVEEGESKKGVPQLKVAFDITEGEYSHYFNDLYKKRKEENPEGT